MLCGETGWLPVLLTFLQLLSLIAFPLNRIVLCSMAMGFLFMGAGTLTFGTSPEAGGWWGTPCSAHRMTTALHCLHPGCALRALTQLDAQPWH